MHPASAAPQATEGYARTTPITANRTAATARATARRREAKPTNAAARRQTTTAPETSARETTTNYTCYADVTVSYAANSDGISIYSETEQLQNARILRNQRITTKVRRSHRFYRHVTSF